MSCVARDPMGGAVKMCDILRGSVSVETDSDGSGMGMMHSSGRMLMPAAIDPFLEGLCSDIEETQAREIAEMEAWLASRSLGAYTSCGDGHGGGMPGHDMGSGDMDMGGDMPGHDMGGGSMGGDMPGHDMGSGDMDMGTGGGSMGGETPPAPPLAALQLIISQSPPEPLVPEADMCAVIVDLLSGLPFGVSPDAACTVTTESQVDSIAYTVTIVDTFAAADAADFVNGGPADVVFSDELSSVTTSTIDIVSVEAAAVPAPPGPGHDMGSGDMDMGTGGGSMGGEMPGHGM